MIYFKCHPVNEDGELLGFVSPQLEELAKHFYYDPPSNGYEIHALDITAEQAEDVLLLQHQQCEVEQVDFSSIEEELKACRLYQEINSRTEQFLLKQSLKKKQRKLKTISSKLNKKLEDKRIWKEERKELKNKKDSELIIYLNHLFHIYTPSQDIQTQYYRIKE